MIYLTGDKHGKFDSVEDFCNKKNTKIDDTLIILGDVGINYWCDNRDKRLKKRLSKLPITLFCIHGNHECVSKDTDILTEDGWINVNKLYNLDNIKIANCNLQNNQITFDYPISKHRSFKQNAVLFEKHKTSHLVSEDHDIIYQNKKIKAKELIGNRLLESEFKHNCANNTSCDIENNWIKLLTWVIMDGCLVHCWKYDINPVENSRFRIQFKLSNKDKINKLINLLNEMNINYTLKESKNKYFYIRIYGDFARIIAEKLNYVKQIPHDWKSMSHEQTKILLDAIIDTDGYLANYNRIYWSTISKHNVDIIQEILIKNNFYCSYIYGENIGYTNSNIYRVSIYSSIECNQYIKPKLVQYNDYMYCFTMPLGTLVTRRNGKVTITGNCRSSNIESYKMEGYLNNYVNVEPEYPNIKFALDGYRYHSKKIDALVIGGAYSVDKDYRISKGYHWWDDEQPSVNIKECINTYIKHYSKFDYILTHTCPFNHIPIEMFIPEIDQKNVDKTTEKWLQYIHDNIVFEKWYCGHFHCDKQVDKIRFLYNDFIELGG